MSSNLHLRPATSFDIPTLASIGHNAFVNDPIDAHWFPLKAIYPGDYKQSFINDLELRLLTPGNVIMVVETDSPEGIGRQDSKEIVAYATFVKHGLNPKDYQGWNPDTLLMKFQRAILHLKTFLATYLLGKHDRSSCPESISSYFSQAAKIYQDQIQTISPTSHLPYLEVRALAVHKLHRRQGHAHHLIAWAQAVASKEQIPIFGDGSPHAVPLYLKNGATEIGRMKLDGKSVKIPGNEKEIKIEGTEAVLMVWKE
ncbi:hypothetical protein QBC44DRAFT_328285 [Cladorrhinum sp. PSN332]|nr:hypothetical protein QBC44DRAFT_328285 [Cladorrhinum sp. PSN332]